MGLTHLCFADDLLIFSEASPKALLGVKEVMSMFHILSGLGVSYNKSELYCSGISEALKTDLAAIMGVNLGLSLSDT